MREKRRYYIPRNLFRCIRVCEVFDKVKPVCNAYESRMSEVQSPEWRIQLAFHSDFKTHTYHMDATIILCFVRSFGYSLKYMKTCVANIPERLSTLRTLEINFASPPPIYSQYRHHSTDEQRAKGVVILLRSAHGVLVDLR